MQESLSSASDKSGLPPGSLVHVGDVLVDETTISIIDYSRDQLNEEELSLVADLGKYKNSGTLTWVIVEGLANVELVEQIGKLFGVHSLVLEDILNTHQRPKFEEYDDYLFIVLKAVIPDNGTTKTNYEQISLLVFNDFVFTFKENKDELLHPLKQRLRASKGRLRRMGSDFLTYSILDTVVDQNFEVLDSFDNAFTILEDRLLSNRIDKSTLRDIQSLKRDIVNVRRFASPLRELVAAMLRSESMLIDEKVHIYLRDVSDHTLRIFESVELHRDMLSGLMEMYVSIVSNRMNEVMKVLTVFASIFIPLTFLTGVYGMNFEYMPELKLKWAYPGLWLAFISIIALLLVYFRRKDWI